MNTDCTVTTATDDEHVIVQAATVEGKVVQLLIERDDALTLADDLTRAAERHLPPPTTTPRGFGRDSYCMPSAGALGTKDRKVAA